MLINNSKSRSLIIGSDRYEEWLTPAPMADNDLAAALRAFPSAEFEALPLDDRVNQIRNDDAACLNPAGPEDAPQLSLGL